MKIEWTYDYTLGTLYQHSAKLTETSVISPFFVLERSSGKCRWEAPESPGRSTMLFPRALCEGVIVAEKCEMNGRHSKFVGIHRFDAGTGVPLDNFLAGATFAARLRGYAGRILSNALNSKHRRAELGELQLRGVQGSILLSTSGEVIDLHSAKILRRESAMSDSPTRWSPAIRLDPLATMVTIPGIGELRAGLTAGAGTAESSERFQDSWPLRFSLCDQEHEIWHYFDPESETLGRRGAVAFDLLLPPFAYFLLYAIETKDEDVKMRRGFCYDLAIRKLDLRTGYVTDDTYLTERPVHKWPSVVDADNHGILVLWRDASSSRSTLCYLGFSSPP